MNLKQQIDNVARALYCAEGEGLSWDREPEILKREFRDIARVAIAILQEEKKMLQVEPREAA